MANQRSLRLTTKTPLQDAQSFTSDWEDVSNYSSLTVALFSDTDTLFYIEFSNQRPSDLGTIKETHESEVFRVTAGNHQTAVVHCDMPSARLRVVNSSGVNQTKLFAETILNESQSVGDLVDTPDAMSTLLPLANGETYDSGIVDLKKFQYLMTELASDQDGQLQGFWYDDAMGSNLIRTFTLPYTASEELSLTGTVTLGKYLRYIFTNNSGSNQTRMLMRVRLSNVPMSGQLLRVEQFIPNNVLSQLTRSILVGKDSNNIYQNVRVNEFGVLSSSSFLIDVARGVVPNITSFTKTGRNIDLDIGTTPETVWHGGGVYTGQPAWGVTPETVQVFSSSADDTAAGTGARTVRLYGLDANGDRIQADVTLNGTTPVNVPTLTWARLNYAEVLTVGSSEYNVGDITARATTTVARIFMVMPAGVNKTAIGASTTPRGKTRVVLGSICRIARLSGAAGSANARLLIREQGSVWRAKFNDEITTDSPFLQPTDTFVIVPELADIKWEIASVSDNNTVATCTIPWIEFDNG